MYFSHGIGWTRSRNLDGMTRTRYLSYGILCSVPPKAKNRETEVSRGFRFLILSAFEINRQIFGPLGEF